MQTEKGQHDRLTLKKIGALITPYMTNFIITNLSLFVCKLLRTNGGQGRNRTADASLFRAALYRLSYLAGELTPL